MSDKHVAAKGVAVGAVRHSEVLVVGAGAAGLAAALGCAPRAVTLLTKTRFGDGGSTAWAQGGVAVALGPDDAPALHAADTLAVAGGLADPRAVARLTGDGPRRVGELIALGARFDRGAGGALAFGREAGHGRRRILHAGGDATGAELLRALTAAVAEAPGVTVEEECFAVDLAVEVDAQGRPRRAVGALAVDREGRAVLYLAGALVLATGGFGQLYRYTTNPAEVTGDGLAMAARAGATLVDLEMVQFHPTALAVAAAAAEDGAPLPLLTEALRGEGAWLVDGAGRRFMPAEHPDAELAPRDVVARAIERRRSAGEAVFLDARAAVGERFPARFPTVFEKATAAGFDPRVEALPVTPAAHYQMGGVAVDGRGRSSLVGLWACGEAASTGVHGANRLASNSLLEALVYGRKVAEDVGGRLAGLPGAGEAYLRRLRVGGRRVERRQIGRGGGGGARGAGGGEAAALTALRRRLRRSAWERVGLVRDGAGLAAAVGGFEAIAEELGALAPAFEEAGYAARRRYLETCNLALAGRLVATAALARTESRGAHCRSDFPQERPAWRRRLSARLVDGDVELVAGEAIGGEENTTAEVAR